ncbi:MAG: ArsA family ATPase [Myxococcales bacterium]|nr:ArsA family ATPase [Myxococcales bacterium]
MILCVGCGGVGKTTTCAALGLAAARRGKRVLCLTIDPAKRLAQSFGLDAVGPEFRRIDPRVFSEAGIAVQGTLTVAMLDVKSTFDGLVTALAPSEEKRKRILDNVLYQYVSTKLAGTQEYMAMEKLYALKDDPAFDLILLDTPPTSHALDFLDAPERLVAAIDSAAVRWFLDSFRSSGVMSLNLLKRTAAMVLRGIGRIIGGGLLEQVAAFVTEMNELFGGWRARAERVSAALRGPDVGYVLVTTPEPMSLREISFFAERLLQEKMAPSAFVVNRCRGVAGEVPASHEVKEQLEARGLATDDDFVRRVLDAAALERRLGERDRKNLSSMKWALEGDASPPLVTVPEFPRDIHDVRRLALVAALLAPNPPA